MRFASLSLWLGCIASTTVAFSTLSPKNIGGGVSRQVINGFNTVSTTSTTTTTRLNVASADTPVSVADMERGVGGRIEAAFEAAKEKGEAAFVSFITAGYPTSQGE